MDIKELLQFKKNLLPAALGLVAVAPVLNAGVQGAALLPAFVESLAMGAGVMVSSLATMP